MRFVQRALIAMSIGMFAVTAMASTASPVNNVDYQSLEKAMPTDSGNKVEVTEFFSYSCPHCNALDPDLAAWVKSKGDSIVFRRIPVQIHEGDQLLQSLYYTMEAMGITEQLHGKVFHALHVDHKQFTSVNDIADFVASQGIDRAKFLGMYSSFSIGPKVIRANQLSEQYKLSSVPMLAIDGRFETSLAVTQTAIGNVPHGDLVAANLKVTDWLIEKVQKEHKQQTASAKK
jgi:thiol:disulfide interchange protein DsbA